MNIIMTMEVTATKSPEPEHRLLNAHSPTIPD
jgi:hypothetical protein